MTSSKRVAVIGSAGQLGKDLVRVLSESGRYGVTPLPRDQMDVTQRQEVLSRLAGERFDVVINCAAFNRVDDCEENVDEALRVNAQGAYEIASACSMAGSLCVYISSDYVFSGKKGVSYTEEDPAEPINVYGLSKLAGELLVKQKADRWLILRISSVFGKFGSRSKGGNFVETILRSARSGRPVRVVSDIWMSPTYTLDVAAVVDELTQIGATGLYHCNNRGRCSWFEFASEAFRIAGVEAPIEPVASECMVRKARRPRDSSMSNSSIETILGHPLRHWQDSLRAYFVEKGPSD